MKTSPKRWLVYDLETYATGFADPQWVPQVITCCAWRELGKSQVKVSSSIDYAYPGAMPHLQPAAIKAMLEPFLADLEKADGVITYNGRRFDNPVLNGTMFYLKMPRLKPILTYDLHMIGKVKGVKKGLDNMAVHWEALLQKLSMNHAEWAEGYLEPGWKTIKKRAQSDVALTEELYHLLSDAGWVAPPKMWTP